jgi:hypothetical protein
MSKVLKPTIKVPFDTLKHVTFGEDLRLNEHIYLHNPTILEVKNFGEQKYLQLVQLLTMRPYDDCAALYKAGLDYADFSDFDIFLRNSKNITPDISSIILGDINFSKFNIEINEELKKPILKFENIIIDEIIFAYIATFVRKINFIDSHIEFDMGNKISRDVYAKRQLEKLQRQSKKQIIFESQLDNRISYICNKSGCKYNYEEIQNIKISILYDMYFRQKCLDEREIYLNLLASGMMDKTSRDDSKLDASRKLVKE